MSSNLYEAMLEELSTTSDVVERAEIMSRYLISLDIRPQAE